MKRITKPKLNHYVISIYRERIYPKKCMNDSQAENASQLLFFLNGNPEC